MKLKKCRRNIVKVFIGDNPSEETKEKFQIQY